MLQCPHHKKTQRREVDASTTPLTSYERVTFAMAKAILAFPSAFHNLNIPAPVNAYEVQL